MQEDTKIDIFVCTYNRAEYLKLCIQSILNQTYQNFNLYILDNCSTDETKKCVNSFTDPRIVYFCHEKNIGADANFRYAFSAARSDYFIVFHDDDIMMPMLVEKELEVAKNNPDIIMVSCKADDIDPEGNIRKKILQKKGISVYGGEEYFHKYLKDCEFVTFPSALYKRDFIQNNGITFNSDAGPSADALIAFEIGRKKGLIAIINEKIMYYRRHNNQYSNTSHKQMIHDLFSYLKKEEYYVGLLNENRKEQGIFYETMLHTEFRLFLGEKISYEDLCDVKKSYDEVFDVKKSKKIIYSFLLLNMRFFPHILHFIYKICRKIKRFVKKENVCERYCL